MTRRIHWGITALIILVIAAGGFMYWQWSQVQQLREQLAQDEKMLEENDKVQHAAVTTDEKPPDERGYKWVRHNDHWDKVPLTGADQKPDPVQQPVTTYKNNDEYVDIDYSVFDKPEELIARIGEIKLNREKYSREEYDRASQENLILLDKLSNGYYGKGEYRDKLEELRNKTYGDALLKRGFGITREELRAMIRGEIPPLVVPIDPAIVEDAANKGGSK